MPPTPSPTATSSASPSSSTSKTTTKTIIETGTSSASPSSTTTRTTTTTITKAGTSSASPSSSSTTKTTGTTITRTTDMVLTATTALVSPVLAGSHELLVESEEGFSVGDTIVITGGGNSETRDIASFGSIVLDAPLDYEDPAGSSITKLGGSYSSNAPWAEEQQDSGRLLTVFVGVVILLLACTALGLGCLMRRGCPRRGRGPAHDRSMRDAQSGTSMSEHQLDQKVDSLQTMAFWFLPVEALMNMPRNKPMFRHQVLRDAGLLVKRTMTLEDVFAGRFVTHTAAVSHRWSDPEHFDPDGSKLSELRGILAKSPSIKSVWIDWACAPQWLGGGRTEEEEEEFRLILENTLLFIFLGCTVIVLYERVYNQRFWPNVECWIATEMATENGLVPASEDRLRLKVHGIDSAKHSNCTFGVLDSWHHTDTQTAIHVLSQKDILVTNARDKEINLKVVGSLDHIIRSRDSSTA
ncbi:unnamed protein product [Prorocentrum cordatum]|uniref:Uncharacterized protein n=1 Tax=Prorocentrum cordatum TaxID=2364126 RepID=A0ABN9QIR2_9DINO|nr:unnamed protein product [Polarella glacialis]